MFGITLWQRPYTTTMHRKETGVLPHDPAHPPPGKPTAAQIQRLPVAIVIEDPELDATMIITEDTKEEDRGYRVQANTTTLPHHHRDIPKPRTTLIRMSVYSKPTPSEQCRQKFQSEILEEQETANRRP